MTDPRTEMKAALKQAMRDKDTLSRDAIRMTLNAVKQVEVDTQKDLDAEEVTGIIAKEVKKREETINELKRAGRTEEAEQEIEAIAVLQQFLPEPLTEEEIIAIVEETIDEMGVSSMQDMGQVMGAVMPKVGNRADGKVVSAEVRKQLQG